MGLLACFKFSCSDTSLSITASFPSSVYRFSSLKIVIAITSNTQCFNRQPDTVSYNKELKQTKRG